jgi:hypothetical protein
MPSTSMPHASLTLLSSLSWPRHPDLAQHHLRLPQPRFCLLKFVFLQSQCCSFHPRTTLILPIIICTSPTPLSFPWPCHLSHRTCATLTMHASSAPLQSHHRPLLSWFHPQHLKLFQPHSYVCAIPTSSVIVHHNPHLPRPKFNPPPTQRPLQPHCHLPDHAVFLNAPVPPLPCMPSFAPPQPRHCPLMSWFHPHHLKLFQPHSYVCAIPTSSIIVHHNPYLPQSHNHPHHPRAFLE